MKYFLLTVSLATLLCFLPAAASAFNPCADINDDESVNVADMTAMLEAWLAGPPLPEGKGDIDLRQNVTMGDFRFLINSIFMGGPEGGCPPHPDYEILPSTDSLILPAGEVPPGTGTIAFPIVIVNRVRVFDLMLPMIVNGLDSTTMEVTFEPSNVHTISEVEKFGAVRMIFLSSELYPLPGVLEPGINLLGTLQINYESSPGATISVDTATFDDRRFVHYTYGTQYEEEIGIPTVLTTEVAPYPRMSVEPDSLFFVTMTSIPITDPDTFTVITDGSPFSWTLTHPSWLMVTPTSGMSGQEVLVLPLISGLPVGVNYGTITVSSDDAFDSPQEVIVSLELLQTYPSFDANCDGTFDIDDLVLLVMYMFAGGDPPCDPCAGQ